ncbi:MAG: glycosyltransferase [Methylomonas sp.]
MKILAAIVTYNRCDLLSRCIDYVHAQTRHADALIVINNGSTDDTLQMLINRNVNVITQENVGSAGGWHRAVQYALDGGFDAVWLMDDDGYPDITALEKLEQALMPGVACASSVVVREDCPENFVFPFPILDKAGLPAIFAKPRKLPSLTELRNHASAGTYPFVHLFNGALVAITAVKQAGNVNSDFFIFGDEVDYFFRLRAVGKVFSVLDARHFHPDVSLRPYTPVKIYYYVKNTLILNTRYFNLVWLRHCLVLVAVLVRTAQRNGLDTALSYLFGTRVSVLYAAVKRGFTGHIGKDFYA